MTVVSCMFRLFYHVYVGGCPVIYVFLHEISEIIIDYNISTLLRTAQPSFIDISIVFVLISQTHND